MSVTAIFSNYFKLFFVKRTIVRHTSLIELLNSTQGKKKKQTHPLKMAFKFPGLKPFNFLVIMNKYSW